MAKQGGGGGLRRRVAGRAGQRAHKLVPRGPRSAGRGRWRVAAGGRRRVVFWDLGELGVWAAESTPLRLFSQ